MADQHLDRLVLATPDLVAATVAWQSVRRYETQVHSWYRQWGPTIWYDPIQWMDLAGLSDTRCAAIASKLRALEFISPEGLVWDPILPVAKRMAHDRIKGKRR